MSQRLNNNQIANDLYSKILADLPKPNELPGLYVVQHIVPNTIPLFKALSSHFDISAIIPKPKSIHPAARAILDSDSDRYPIVELLRSDLEKIDDGKRCHQLNGKMSPRGAILLDVGAYFLGCLSSSYFHGKIRGIIEDTENGHEKYEKMYKDGATTPFPIFSVARSPLKEPEDFLVGQSIVFSTEKVIRENYSLLINRQVLVIGYGKIGRSISQSLASRNISVWVYDTNPVKRAQALAHGFRVPDRDFAIRNAGLIFGATGRGSLKSDDFTKLRTNVFIASVTSSDDEFDLTELSSQYRKKENGENIVYYSQTNVINLINDGNAVNFLHSNALGIYIYLVACEILQCLHKISTNNFSGTYSQIVELSSVERETTAELWLNEMAPSAWTT